MIIQIHDNKVEILSEGTFADITKRLAILEEIAGVGKAEKSPNPAKEVPSKKTAKKRGKKAPKKTAPTAKKVSAKKAPKKKALTNDVMCVREYEREAQVDPPFTTSDVRAISRNASMICQNDNIPVQRVHRKGFGDVMVFPREIIARAHQATFFQG